jgi:hypothetical protein
MVPVASQAAPTSWRHGFVDEADGFIEDGRATIEMRKLF